MRYQSALPCFSRSRSARFNRQMLEPHGAIYEGDGLPSSFIDIHVEPEVARLRSPFALGPRLTTPPHLSLCEAEAEIP